jgi:hypothetical protein
LIVGLWEMIEEGDAGIQAWCMAAACITASLGWWIEGGGFLAYVCSIAQQNSGL